MDLKSCPSPDCKGNNSHVFLKQDTKIKTKWFGWVVCDFCGMTGPTGLAEDLAKQLWNNLPRN
jgi:hypothetical protein